MKTSQTCQDARYIVLHYLEHGSEPGFIDLVMNGMIEVDPSELDPPTAAAYRAARHIDSCEDCMRWRDARDPAAAALRARSALYCCVSMYHAVTDPDVEVPFSFEWFRGETACWCIGEDRSFARYCPWCGSELPCGPFEAAPGEDVPPVFAKG